MANKKAVSLLQLTARSSYGRSDWTRTSDPLLPKQVRYHTAPRSATKNSCRKSSSAARQKSLCLSHDMTCPNANLCLFLSSCLLCRCFFLAPMVLCRRHPSLNAIGALSSSEPSSAIDFVYRSPNDFRNRRVSNTPLPFGTHALLYLHAAKRRCPARRHAKSPYGQSTGFSLSEHASQRTKSCLTLHCHAPGSRSSAPLFWRSLEPQS